MSWLEQQGENRARKATKSKCCKRPDVSKGRWRSPALTLSCLSTKRYFRGNGSPDIHAENVINVLSVYVKRSLRLSDYHIYFYLVDTRFQMKFVVIWMKYKNFLMWVWQSIAAFNESTEKSNLILIYKQFLRTFLAWFSKHVLKEWRWKAPPVIIPYPTTGKAVKIPFTILQ